MTDDRAKRDTRNAILDSLAWARNDTRAMQDKTTEIHHQCLLSLVGHPVGDGIVRAMGAATNSLTSALSLLVTAADCVRHIDITETVETDTSSWQ